MGSIKCPQCGLTNFDSAEKCKRCSAVLTESVNTSAPQSRPLESPKTSRNKIVLAVAGIVLVALLGFGIKAKVTQARIEREREAAATAREEAVAKNNEIGNKAIDQLRRLQSAAEGGLSYTKYADLVTTAKMETDAALRRFSTNDGADKQFVNEVNLAMEYYIAAKDSWNIAIRYSSVTTQEERDEKLNEYWGQAMQHTEGAEKYLAKPTTKVASL